MKCAFVAATAMALSSFPSAVSAQECSGPSSALTQSIRDTFVAGRSRSYRITVPATTAGVELPVVFAYHGGGGSSHSIPFPQQTQFDQLANSENFIMVYPLGAAWPGNEGSWLLNTGSTGDMDIQFMNDILGALRSSYCVDNSRIYATGYSLGSMYTYEPVCQMSDTFAAVASFAGFMPVNPTTCETDNVAVMHIHGTSDSIIPYFSEWDWKEWPQVGTMMDIPQLVDFWSSEYNCQNTTTVGSHTVHSSCGGNARVEHYRLEGQSHSWPNTVNGQTTARLIWNFLSDFSKGPTNPTPPSPSPPSPTGAPPSPTFAPPSPTPAPPSTECKENTCEKAYNGICDDGGPGSTFSFCAYQTDCYDCCMKAPWRSDCK